MTHKSNVQEILKDVETFGTLSRAMCKLEGYLSAVKIELEELKEFYFSRTKKQREYLAGIYLEIQRCEEAIALGEKV